MKIALFILLVTSSLWAKSITANDIYAQVELIQEEMHSLVGYMGAKHQHEDESHDAEIRAELKPRNIWQLSYEILQKINMLRTLNGLSRVEPVGIEPVLELDSGMVYEQTQRVLTEIKIFKVRKGVKSSGFKAKVYKNKTLDDVFYTLNDISKTFDEINRVGFTPSYVFAESMRVYDDLTIILEHLNIKDNTIPSKRDEKSTTKDTFVTSIKMLDAIKEIQKSAAIVSVDFTPFIKKNPTPSDVFTMIGMIISELQTIKAYIGLRNYVTTPATTYKLKTPVDVNQMMNWNLRKVLLIKKLSRG